MLMGITEQQQWCKDNEPMKNYTHYDVKKTKEQCSDNSICDCTDSVLPWNQVGNYTLKPGRQYLKTQAFTRRFEKNPGMLRKLEA